MPDLGCFSFILWLCGPISIALCIKLFIRTRNLSDVLDSLSRRLDKAKMESSPSALKKPVQTALKPISITPPVKPPVDTTKESKPPVPPKAPLQQPAALKPKTLVKKPVKPPLTQPVPLSPPKPKTALEERIGTRWVLIAGVIAVIFSAAFFLKYAYDHFTISELGRVIAVTTFGLIALVVGEVTRRRNYDIVAKGVTALGFGLLYAAVFAAFHYELIDVYPAFAISIVITICAMAYAVILDEIVIAFLSLFGGFLTPLVVSTGQNVPGPLFSYVLVLSVGAMLCAYFRRWRAVNFLAWIGTWAIYATWYESFVRKQLNQSADLPRDVSIALGWLAVFFVIYLIMPILNGLVKKIKAGKEDVTCVLGNAMIAFFFLWNTLYQHNRLALAWCAVGMCIAHLAVMAVARIRSGKDTALQIVLLALGLSFLTIAMPLYWKFNILAIAWAVEAVILALIGLRFKNLLTQIFAAIAFTLSCANLVLRLPMQTEAFNFLWNPTFGTWCFVAAAACVGHLFYRFTARTEDDEYGRVAQILYILMAAILFAAATMEWFFHCEYNLPGNWFGNILKGDLVILSALTLLFIVRPICPNGSIRKAFAIVFTITGSICMLLLLPYMHQGEFSIIANQEFAIALGFIAVVTIYHLICRFKFNDPDDDDGIRGQLLYAVVGLLLLAALSAEWYWYCYYNIEGLFSWPLFYRGQIILTALIILPFTIRPICPEGKTCSLFASMIAATGSVFVMIVLPMLHDKGFRIFVNTDFAVALFFTAALCITAWLLKRRKCMLGDSPLAPWFGFAAVFVLFVLISEEIWMYWYCKDNFGPGEQNWQFLAYMYLSIAWALYGAAMMVTGFVFKMKILRYLALGLFALLLAKVFILDMSKVIPIYRIAAFFATGITLVGVSYLYQFLKKKGFFETLPTQQKLTDSSNQNASD